MKSNTASDAATLLTWQPFSRPDAAAMDASSRELAPRTVAPHGCHTQYVDLQLRLLLGLGLGRYVVLTKNWGKLGKEVAGGLGLKLNRSIRNNNNASLCSLSLARPCLTTPARPQC